MKICNSKDQSFVISLLVQKSHDKKVAKGCCGWKRNSALRTSRSDNLAGE